MEKYLKILAHSSLFEIYSAIRKKIFGGSSWQYSFERITKSKHVNFCLLIDRWERYIRVISRNSAYINKDFEFEDKTIFELGCGPLFGWSPLALFLGAKKYYYYEPNISLNLLASEEMKEIYFLPLYNELVSNYGTRMEFEDFYSKIFRKTKEIDFNLKNSIDLTLSNSVLEHIPRNEIFETIKSLHDISKEKSYFFHVVDFGDHTSASNKFKNMYKRDWSKATSQLNYLRMPDIEKLIKDAGFISNQKIVYRKSFFDKSNLHSSWKKYSDKDLSSRVVIFVGVKS